MPIVSICIPTKDRLEHLKKTIDSIINDNVNANDYEIVISDNSESDVIKNHCNHIAKQGYNIKHVRNPVLGFYNSIIALRNGSGALLKLHNDYSCFLPGQFAYIVELAKHHQNDAPIIFFANGTLKLVENTWCDSKDQFIATTHFQNSWSSAFSIWKADFDNIPHEKEDVNPMFPHTSLLLNSANKNFLICDKEVFENIAVAGKGGYNLFQCFCITYLGLIKDKVKTFEISETTFRTVKWKMYLKFVIPWYFKTVYTNQGYTFIMDNADNILKKTYGLPAWILIRMACKIKKII
uniref:glycosyltransferase n=1 Tax=Serratia marcescens TaxID=615 RepID=UPI0011E86F79